MKNLKISQAMKERPIAQSTNQHSPLPFSWTPSHTNNNNNTKNNDKGQQTPQTQTTNTTNKHHQHHQQTLTTNTTINNKHLVDEEKEALVRGLGPGEQQVQLRDRGLSQRTEVTPTHHRVVEAALKRQPTRHHGLALTRRKNDEKKKNDEDC